MQVISSGLSLRAGSRGFSPATKRVAPGQFFWENRRKIEPKEIPSRLIPRLLVVFTRQLEILVTTLQLLRVFFLWQHIALCMLYKVVQSLAKYPKMVNHLWLKAVSSTELLYHIFGIWWWFYHLLLQSKYLVLSVNIQLKATVTYWAVFSSDEIVLMFDLVGEILLCDH